MYYRRIIVSHVGPFTRLFTRLENEMPEIFQLFLFLTTDAVRKSWKQRGIKIHLYAHWFYNHIRYEASHELSHSKFYRKCIRTRYCACKSSMELNQRKLGVTTAHVRFSKLPQFFSCLELDHCDYVIHA